MGWFSSGFGFLIEPADLSSFRLLYSMNKITSLLSFTTLVFEKSQSTMPANIVKYYSEQLTDYSDYDSLGHDRMVVEEFERFK